MKRPFSRRAKRRASSLIVTLLVLVILSTIIVAFMQSMSVERKTARSMANQYRAVLVSDAAVQAAIHDLVETTNSGPYSTIFSLEPGKTSPYLFQAKLTNMGTSVGLLRYPQFSTLQSASTFTNASAQIIPTNSYTVADLDKGASVSRTVTNTTDIYVNLNATNNAFPYGQIGLTSGNNSLSVPVNWIYFRDKDGAVIGRYSYWVDDESSKIDLRIAGNTLGPSGTHLRGNGTNGNEISLNALTNGGFSPSLLTNLFGFKASIANRLGLSEARYGETNISDTNWAKIRPYLTMYSLHDDRAPGGKRKLNLNAAVTNTTNPVQITAQVNAIRDALTDNVTNFGERYYKQNGGTNTTVSPARQTNYVTKIAANIRDFIDTDRNATVILKNGQATTNNAPNFITYNPVDGDDIPVFGKEHVPLLNEYLRVVRLISPIPDPTTPNAALRDVTFRITHYVELWNLGPTAITYSQLGTNPFVCLANRTPWENGSSGLPSILRPIDIRMYLPANFSIPAGGYAVVATDGSDYTGPATCYVLTRLPGDTTGLDAPSSGTWQAVDAGGQTFPTGDFEDYIVSTSRDSTHYFFTQSAYDGTYTDCHERLLFANDQGLLDYTPAIFTVQNSTISYKPEDNPGFLSTFISDNKSYTANNTFSGADTEARYSRGDPRSNSEPIAVDLGTSAVWKTGLSANGSLPIQSTLGIQNYNLILEPTGVALWRQGWNEYTSDIAGNQYVADSNLFSLGQLGYIYDPARYDSAGYRGAGRTLRIGQSDDSSNNRNANSTNASFQNWLGGLGSTNITSTNSLLNASRLLNVFRTDDTNYGRINPNAIARGSNNLAVRALLEGFSFSTDTTVASSALSGQPLIATNVMTSMNANVTNGRPFIGVGSLSDLPIFNTGTTLAGVNMAATNVSDAGKEEFFRRTANLMTTESLAFTILSKAQTGSFRGNKFYPSSTVTRETTVQFLPTYPANQDRPLPDSWQMKVVRDMFY